MADEFSNVGQSPGVEVFRIEQGKPTPQPADGRLYTGDAYIALHTRGAGSQLTYHIHYWLGSACSSDEAGGAAILAVTLDNQLQERGADASISRHTQGKEGDAFVALFPDGITYQPGGAAGGLVSPKNTSAPELYRVSGKKHYRVSTVPVEAKSVTKSDAFVLDLRGQDKIVAFMPEKVSKHKQYRTLSLARDLSNTYHAGVAKLGVVVEGDTKTYQGLGAAFFETLKIQDPSSFSPQPSSTQAAAKSPPRIWSVEYMCEGDENGVGWPLNMPNSPRMRRTYSSVRASAKVTSQRLHEVDESPSARMLAADSMLLLHADGTIYAWLGKFVPHELRQNALNTCEKLRFQQELPESVGLQIVKQGLEDPVFKTFFGDWEVVQREALGRLKAAGPTANNDENAEGAGNDSKQHYAMVDAAAMAQTQTHEEPAVDDGSGSKSVWRVENFELAEIPEEQHGMFYAGDSYVVLYTYGNEDSPQYIVYMWQGASSTADERGACAMHAVKLDDEKCEGKAAQVRLVQGKESAHFVSLWSGKMLVLFGGVQSGFRTLDEVDEQRPNRLFQVKGDSSTPVYAAEVEASASSLNSGDSFVLLTKDSGMAWLGSGSPKEEQSVAETALQTLADQAGGKEQVETISEGSEPEAFWEALGGKGEYPKVSEVAIRDTPRLFQLSDATTGGAGLAPEEIHNFGQVDLSSSDCFLLDTHDAVTIWIGKNASSNEIEQATPLAHEYLKSTGRGDDVPVTTVKEEHEPPFFTVHFHGWDPNLKSATAEDYEARIAALQAEMGGPEDEPEEPSWVQQAEAVSKSNAEQGGGEAEAAPEAEAAEEEAAEERPKTPEQQPSAPEEEPKTPEEQPKSPEEQPKTPEARPATGKSEASVDMSASQTSSGSRKFTSELPSGGPLTPGTVRGRDYQPTEKDPSGSQPTDLKYVPGQDTIALDQLRNMKGPDGIDPARKEEYLSEAEFLETFGMSLEQFKGQKLWRRQDQKKKAGLF